MAANDSLIEEFPDVETPSMSGIEEFPDEPPQRGGYWTEAARGLTQFAPAIVKTTSTVGDKLGNLVRRGVGLEPLPLELPEARPLYKAGQWMQDKLDAAYPAVPEPQRNLGHDVSSGLGQMGSMLAGGLAARGAGATLAGAALVGTGLGFSQEFDDAFSRARQRGDDPDTALWKSLGYASLAAMIENKLGAGRIIKKYFPDPAEAARKLSAWGVSKATAISLAVGFGEEGSQRFAQNWIVEGKPSLEGIIEEGTPGGIVQAIAELPAHLLRGRGGKVRTPIPRLPAPPDTQTIREINPDGTFQDVQVPPSGLSIPIEQQGEQDASRQQTPIFVGKEEPPRPVQGMATGVASQIPQPAVEITPKETTGASIPAQVTLDSVLAMTPAQYFDASTQWSAESMSEAGGISPQIRAELAAKANPDLKAWQDAQAKASADFATLRAAAKADPNLMGNPEFQKQFSGAAQRASFFSEGRAVLDKTKEFNPKTVELSKPQTTTGSIEPPSAQVQTGSPVASPGASLTPPVSGEQPPATATGVLKIGDPIRIMGVDSVLADTKTIGGVRYDLFNGAKLAEKRAAIRVTDVDTGNVVTLKQHPTYDAAEAEYTTATQPETKPAAPVATPVGAKTAQAQTTATIKPNEQSTTIGGEPIRPELGGVGNRERARARETLKSKKPTSGGMVEKPETGAQPSNRNKPTELRPNAEAATRIEVGDDVTIPDPTRPEKRLTASVTRIEQLPSDAEAMVDLNFSGREVKRKPISQVEFKKKGMIRQNREDAAKLREKIAAEKKPTAAPAQKPPAPASDVSPNQSVAQAVAKVGDHIDEIKAEASRLKERNESAAAKKRLSTAKEVKSELVERLEKAIEDAPSINDEKPADWKTKITIEIPGDGEFTIFNDKESLTGLLERAKKIDTRSNTPVRIPRSTARLKAEDQQVIEAYGSPEEAYLRVKAQNEAVDAPSESLLFNIYQETKAGKLEAQAEVARSTASERRSEAKESQIEIDRIMALKKRTKAHDESLDYLRQRVESANERGRVFEQSAEKFQSDADIEKKALGIELPAPKPVDTAGVKVQTELSAADDFAGKASNIAERAVVEWATHVEDVVNPLKKQIRQINSEVQQMAGDARRTKPESKSSQRWTKKKFLEQYRVSSMEEANALYKKKNAEWAELEKQLEAAEAKRRELETVKERRAKEWSSAATRAGELRRQVYSKVKEGDAGTSRVAPSAERASRVTVKAPSGTESIRATMPDGTQRIIPLAEFESSPITDATKLEAVARDRRGDWQPVKGEVTLTEQQPENPHTSPESEENSERARKLGVKAEVVVQTEQEALDKMVQGGDQPLAASNGAAYYHNGIIYYILDNIRSPEQFLAVQREEIAHHINSSPEAKKVLAELGRAPEFELERREIRGSYPKVESETADAYSERIANEMLAKSRVQDRGLFQRMMDWLIDKLSNVPRIGDWIRESASNRQAILRTISRRLESNFTAAGKTDVPLAAMANTQVQGAPVGIEREQENIEAIQKIIRADIFDGTQPITEAATEQARTLFNRLTDTTGKSAATGEILSKTNAQMGPGLVLAELWRYAEKMVLNNGDDWLLRHIVPRYQDFNLGEGGATAYGRGLRALQETDTLFRQLYEIEKEKRSAAGQKMSVGPELLDALIERLRQVSPDAAEIEADFDATAGVKPPKSLKSLIESIRTSPYANQSDPVWRKETAIQWFLSAGYSREQAELAAVKFQAAFDKAFAKALEREARAVLGKKTPPTKIEEIVRAIRAGVTDPATALVDHFAKEAGFNPATPAQHKRLVELDQKVADRDLSLPERHIAIGEMNGIFRQMKLPPTVLTKLSANFVATLLTGLRTLTVNIFAPATHLLTERVLLSATNPRDIATHWKALAGGWSNWLREAQFTATEDVMTYLNDDFRGATNVLKRMWEDGVRDMRSGNPKQQAKGLWQLVSGAQQYAMRMLNAADQANMRAESEAMLVLYGSDVLRQAGFGTKEVEMMVRAVPRIKNELIQQGLDQGMSPKLARVRADSLLAEKLRAFVKDDISELAGDEFGEAVNAAELEGYNITGRLGIETDTREPMKETDEGGMLSRLVLHHVLEWSSKMRSKPGSGPAVAVALLGYLNVPLRTARFYAWNSGYGLIRLGIHAFRKRKGWDNWWKQSLGNELQERHRLKMAVAATVAQAIIVGAGFALLKGSDDDDAGEDKLGVYVTGDGPKNKNLKDAWTRRGFQAQSIVMFVAGKPVRVPLTRLGEPLAHVFWPLSALDDWRWRKKEAEASGRPFAEPPSETVMRSIGTYAGLLGQRGPLQSVTQWAKVGSGEGGTAKILAQQASRVVSAAVTPWLGLQSSASAMIYGPIDQSSISAAIYASMPILGLFGEKFRKQQVNRFGDPLYDQSWYAKIAQTGVPIAFRVANTPENQKVYGLLTDKGAAPPVLRRYILEERFGPLTNDQFERFAETSGRRLKQEVTNNEANLRGMSSEAAKNWINKTTTRVDRQTELDMNLQRVKPLKVSGGGGGYSILGAASIPRGTGVTISQPRSGRRISFAGSRRRRTSLRSYRSRGRSRLRRPRLTRFGSRDRVRRVRLYGSRIRRPRLSLA